MEDGGGVSQRRRRELQHSLIKKLVNLGQLFRDALFEPLLNALFVVA
jgi:hypothetical protein